MLELIHLITIGNGRTLEISCDSFAIVNVRVTRIDGCYTHFEWKLIISNYFQLVQHSRMKYYMDMNVKNR